LKGLTRHLDVFKHLGNISHFSDNGGLVLYQAYEEHIINYTELKMTYDCDSLSAIQAILESLKHIAPGIDFCFGIPVTSMLGTESPTLVYRLPFALSLCWAHGTGVDEMVPLRRVQFPSYI
jgi:hypothetical protein